MPASQTTNYAANLSAVWFRIVSYLTGRLRLLT